MAELRPLQEVTDERDELVLLRADLQGRRDAANAEPSKYAAERISHIDTYFVETNGRPPVQNRRAKKRGNVSMYDHLQQLKAKYQETPHPNRRTQDDISRMDSEISKFDDEIDQLNQEIQSRGG